MRFGCTSEITGSDQIGLFGVFCLDVGSHFCLNIGLRVTDRDWRLLGLVLDGMGLEWDWIGMGWDWNGMDER